MLWVCFALLQILKIVLGTWLVYKVFPDIHIESGFRRILAAVLLAGIAYLQIGDYWLAFASYLNPLIVAVVIAVICALTVEKEKSAVFVLCWFYNVSLELLKIPYLVLVGMFKQETLFWANYGDRNWWEALWCLFILLFVLLLILYKKNNLVTMKKLLEKHSKSVFLLGVAEWFLFTGIMWMGGKQAFSTSALMMTFLGIFCVILLLLYLMMKIVWRETENEKNIMIASQNLLLKHHEELKDVYAKGNQRMHDTKHVILYLKNCIEENRLEEAMKQIDLYTESLQSAEKTIWTGFEFTDFLINTKKAMIDSKQIDFRLEVDLTHMPLSDSDVGVLLGNLFDNAIEAAEKCASGARSIYLKLCSRNEMFYLRMSNSSIQRPKVVNGKFISSKEGDLHGFGIENVRSIVENYQGSIDFQYDESSFEVTVLI